ncbi:Asparagine synthetase domain-containing protein [Drosera capensis]
MRVNEEERWLKRERDIEGIEEERERRDDSYEEAKMCGIALIVSGIRLTPSSIIDKAISPSTKSESVAFTVDDLKAALRRRGPDSLGSKRVLLELEHGSSSKNEAVLVSSVVEDDETDSEVLFVGGCREMGGHGSLDNGENGVHGRKIFVEMNFIGAVLQLRGEDPVVQPLVDTSVNILVYNGEIFGGIEIGSNRNDAETLMQSLGGCCSCYSHRDASTCVGKNIPELLSSLKGPWGIIYWQDASKTLWFARDAFGRRSLLVHWPSPEDSRLLFTSVSPPCSSSEALTSEALLRCLFLIEPACGPYIFFNSLSCLVNETEDGSISLSYWEELPCGVYSLTMGGIHIAEECIEANTYLHTKLRKHEWTNSTLQALIDWERKFVVPTHEHLHSSGCLIPRGLLQSLMFRPAKLALAAMRESVFRRSIHNSTFQEGSVPIAVLFSGGLDSMILAALLHECLSAKYDIDLLNVSFDGESAPDRITARAGVEELKRFSPSRRWRLVEIDDVLSNLVVEMKHVMSLINPAKTYMDLNIGTALWLAARGHGWMYEASSDSNDGLYKRVRYKSKARILLVGSGADEQCAGYGRHRTKFRSNSWSGLQEEMKLDMQRIWKRNLGRDDRCIADNGKEARFPFLDEDVIRVLLDSPLWEIADLNQPTGTGDKKILREVARLLGLHDAAALPKRAIQFGSRIAQESNRKNFGSNRAANMASAGSVEFFGS